MKPHKWATEIKAWADGAEIESNCAEEGWQDDINPYWNDNDFEFRIKPQPKKPNQIQCNCGRCWQERDDGNWELKSQLKEPQYLYVYHTTKGIELGYAPHNGMNMYNTKIVGKIKLEVDDE